MLPQEGGFAIMLQEAGIANRAQEMHVAAALSDKGYISFFSSRLAETGSSPTSRGGGLLTAVSSRYVAEHEVFSFTELVPGKAAALEIRTDKGGLTLINVHGPEAGSSPLGAMRGVLGRHTNIRHGAQPWWMAPGDHRWRHQHLHGCRYKPSHGAFPLRLGGLGLPEGQGRQGGRHDPPALPVPTEGGHLPGQQAPPAMAPAGKRLGQGHGHPEVVGSDHLPVGLVLPGLLDTAGQAAVPTPYSHTEVRLLPYDTPSHPSSAACGRRSPPHKIGEQRQHHLTDHHLQGILTR